MAFDPALEQATAPVAPAGMVLLVDDDRDCADAHVDALRHYLWQTRWVATIPEALAMLDGWAPDVILLDLRLPGIDGFDGLRAIVRAAPDVPVAIYSAHSLAGVATEAVQAGARDVLAKSIRRGESGQTQAEALVIRLSVLRAQAKMLSRDRSISLAEQQLHLLRQVVSALAELKVIAVHAESRRQAILPSVAAMIPYLSEKRAAQVSDILVGVVIGLAGYLARGLLWTP